MSAILTAVAQVRTRPQFVYIHFKLKPPWHFHLPYMDIGVTQQNNRPNSRVDNAIWRHVCNNIVNTDNSQVTWLGHVTDVILGANPVLSSSRFAPESTKLSINGGRKLPLRGGAFPAQTRCPTIREVTPAIFQQQQFECSAVFFER